MAGFLRKAIEEDWPAPPGYKDQAEDGQRRPQESCIICNGEGWYSMEMPGRLHGIMLHCDHSGRKRDLTTLPLQSGLAGADGVPVWDCVLEKLKEIVTRPSYQTWIKGTKCLAMHGNVVFIEAPNAYVAEMLATRMYSLLVSAVREAMKHEALEVEVVVREG
jgi:hypothetical protein